MEKKYIEFEIETSEPEFEGEEGQTAIIRIYPMDVLEDKSVEWDEDEKEEFVCGSWLYVSFSVGSVLYCQNKDFSEARNVYDMMHTDKDWFKKVTWTKEQRLAYEKRVHDLLMRFVEMDDDDAWHDVQLWSGFGSAPSLEDTSDQYYKEYLDAFNKQCIDSITQYD